MKSFRHLLALLSLSACVSAALPAAQRRPAPARRAAQTSTREEAYRANNVGVALLEQFKHGEGAEAFRRALSIEPRLALARVNLAIALYNVPDAEGARREAEAALALAPDAPQPHYILGLIAKSQNRPDDAVTHFRRVLQIDPDDVGANVSLGQVYAQQRRYEEAVRHFRAALAAEPYNGTALYNLGTALLRAGGREEGQRVIARFQQLRQSGVETTIGQNYLEQGRYAEAVASTGAEADLVDRRTPQVVFADATASVMPRGGAAWPPNPPAPREAAPARGAAENRPACAAQYPGGVLLPFDQDGDGDLDLLAGAPPCAKLYRNDGGRFADVTAQSGLTGGAARGTAAGALAGDYDNDGRPDVLFVGADALALFRNEGAGRFRDVTSAARLPAYPHASGAAAFFDADHDGDLDIFVAGGSDAAKSAARGVVNSSPGRPAAPAPNLFLRNNGDGSFADATAAAKLDAPAGNAVAVVPTDFDNRRDTDLLVVRADSPPVLWKNMRDGTFADVAADVGLGLKGEFVSAAAGDVNKDGFTDFYFGRAEGPGEFALSDGRGRFKVFAATAADAPAGRSDAPAGQSGTSAAQFLDYDNDGLLDLLTLQRRKGRAGGLRVLRNTGDGWSDVSESAARGLFAEARDYKPQPASFASGDVDGDGDVDLWVAAPRPPEGEVGRPLVFARNEGGNRNRSLRVSLAGKVSNRGGVGAKVEMRAGSLRQKLETYSAAPAPAPAEVLFGLGSRETADAVRVLWPSGVVQAEIEVSGGAATDVRTSPGGRNAAKASAVTLPITELDRKPSSCPYLYAWDGERFRFVTDFLGGGEMGYLISPGHFNHPDPVEYVRIRDDQLKERAGRYELRVTNELEEALFADRFQLLAVAHPRGVEVYPNEGMTASPRPFVLHKTRGARPPLSAADGHGHDVLARVARMDRLYPDDFRRERLRGYAEEHALTLRLAPDGSPPGGRVLLLLTGWTDYAWSSDNVAASQAGKALRPPALQVRDEAGAWKTVADVGIPVGRPQTVTVDLTGKFLSASREVRILTSMRILWDQILVDTSAGDFPAETTALDPVSASLRWRGFSRETTPDGREPYGYDYERVSAVSPWKAMPGRYTREGDVRELLLAADDLFVVSLPGDEISLSFDAARLPPLPQGWTRTFLLYADGYSKEMDINSATPDQVSPLPFRGMTRYPYAPPEAYPLTAERRAYLERYNTRVVGRELPSLDSLLLTLSDARGSVRRKPRDIPPPPLP